eukprot:g23513.t1
MWPCSGLRNLECVDLCRRWRPAALQKCCGESALPVAAASRGLCDLDTGCKRNIVTHTQSFAKVPPKRPYDPVYDSPVAKRIQEEWFKPKERPLEDYFNEWFIPLFLLAAFIWILPAMSPGTWGVKERRSNRAKARSAARNLLGRLRNFGKEEVY